MSDNAKAKNVYAFIDSQNLNVGTQKFGWKMDWQKFRRWLTDKYGVAKAYMFIGYVPEFEALYEQMHDAGYMVVLKPTYDMTKPMPDLAAVAGMQNEGGEEAAKPDHGNYHGRENGHADNQEKKPVKGNIDADLVLWAMKEIGNYDKMLLVSGDGDFFSLVEYLESKKRLGHILTPSFQYSQLYNKFEEYIVRLDQYKHELRYHDRKPGMRKKSDIKTKS